MGISYLKKAENISSKSDPSGYLPYTMLNLGEAYRLKGSLDSSYFYLKKSLFIKKNIKDDLLEIYALGNIGLVFSAQGDLNSAKEYLSKSLDLLKSKKDFYSRAVYTSELGLVYLKEKKYHDGEEKLQEALSIAKSANLKEQIRDISEMLSKFHESQKEYANALVYQKLFQVYQDSLVNKVNVKKIEQLKAGYEIDKRETKIGILSQVNSLQKKWVLSLAIVLSILVLLFYLLYLGNKKIKRKNKLLSKQKQLISKREQEKVWLLRELNHRVKNNLQMVISLLSLQSNNLEGHPAQDAIIAGQQRVEALSLVHRKLYQEGIDTCIHVKEYISELVLGLFYAYEVDFEPNFDIENVSINIDTAIPLALIINEIIINALKYAYNGIKNPSLKINIYKSDQNRITIIISDNGIGFKKEDTQKSESLGLKIIHSLITQLEGTIEHSNKNGTNWEMEIKNK